MLVQALVDFAQTRLRDQLGDPAFESKPVPFALSLSAAGKFLGWIPFEESVQKGKKTVKITPAQTVPKSPVNRNSGSHPLLAFDDAKYVFGVGEWTKPGQESDHTDKHKAFVALLAAAHSATYDEGLAACVVFYDSPDEVEKAKSSFDPRTTGGIFLSLYPSGPIIHRPAVQDFWRRHYASRFSDRNDAGGSGMCLVTGQIGPIAPTHDKIKGAASIGGQAAGVSLMSFDKEAFHSYGWDRCANSPVSPSSAQAYVLALNHLLAGREVSRQDHNGIAYLYWLREPDTEFNPMSLLEQADPEQVSRLLQLRLTNSVSINPNDFYFLGVSGNGGRLVVRQWIHQSLEQTLANVSAWFKGLEIMSPFAPGLAPYPKHWELLKALARDEPPPGRSLELFERALLGRPLGYDMLAAILGRLRVEQGAARLRPARMSLLRLVVNDQLTIHSPENILMSASLNPDDTNPAYLCGRLLALCDSLQYYASGTELNRTVADRYFTLASSNPSLAFPHLEELAFKHLRKLQRGEGRSVAISLDRQMNQVRLAIGSVFPGPLSLIDQGRFALGFHHQRAESFQAAEQAKQKKAGN